MTKQFENELHPHYSNAAKPTSLLHDNRFVDKIESEIYTKANLIQSMTDFTLLNYPPNLGGWAND